MGSRLVVDGYVVNGDNNNTIFLYMLIQAIIRAEAVETIICTGELDGNVTKIALCITPTTKVAAYIEGPGDDTIIESLADNTVELRDQYLPSMSAMAS